MEVPQNLFKNPFKYLNLLSAYGVVSRQNVNKLSNLRWVCLSEGNPRGIALGVYTNRIHRGHLGAKRGEFLVGRRGPTAPC
jgi:hypothetical protein